jgi:hypothetical protein
MARPVFISYAWDDLDEVDELDRALRLRGVPVWRDRRNMDFGTYNEDRVRDGINDLCSGFALYYTDDVLRSEFIQKIELPAMDARRRRGSPPEFFAGAILRRQKSFPDAAADLRQLSEGISIGESLGNHVSDEDFDADLRQAANDILASYVKAEAHGEEVTLRIATRGDVPNSDPAQLHLCWCPPLDHDLDQHPEEVWGRELLPALSDLRTALETALTPRHLRISGSLHLSAAIALGWEFRQPTGFSLDLDHEFVSCKTSLAEPNSHGWRLNVEPGPSDGEERLCVCLHATQDVANAMRHHRRDLPPARAILHIYPPSGSPSRTSVDPLHGNALAAAVAAKINACRTRYGISQTHLYLACPWPLAVLLGWHLSSSGRLVMHEPDVSRSSYRATYELA